MLSCGLISTREKKSVANQRCASCDGYERKHHNYCRKCGLELKPGFAKYVPIAEGYFADEKYCGYCGKPIDECGGAH